MPSSMEEDKDAAIHSQTGERSYHDIDEMDPKYMKSTCHFQCRGPSPPLHHGPS